MRREDDQKAPVSQLPPAAGDLLERTQGLLADLSLTWCQGVLESHLEQAAKREATYGDFLHDLLLAEREARRQRQLTTRMQLAHLPCVKGLSQFDFSFQPSIDERQVRELATLAFVHEAGNVIFLGPPGVGKTHLSVALAVEAISGGFSAYFVSAYDMVADLSESMRQGRLSKRMPIYTRPRVLVIDEVGYLPLDEMGATIFFQVITARYERGSIILTSNRSYADWGAFFGEQTIATAILDRLLHHSVTVNIRGESYRLKDRRKAGLSSQPAPRPQAPEA
jgi:DNA replication protein DnaC